MFIKDFLTSVIFYIWGFSGLILSCYSIYDEGICSGTIGSSSPLDIFMMSVFVLLFTFLVTKIDPGYLRIRKNWFLIFVFFTTFTMFILLGVNMTASNLYDILC